MYIEELYSKLNLDTDIFSIIRKINKELVNIYNTILVNNRIINITTKDGNDIVSNIDLLIESRLKNFLQKLINYETYFLSEEIEYRKDDTYEHLKKNDKLFWIVDPLDGTVNFSKGLPLYSISIALYKGINPILGFVFAPELKKGFFAVNGYGAYEYNYRQKPHGKYLLPFISIRNRMVNLNLNKIEPSSTKYLKESVGSINITSHYSEFEYDESLKLLSILSNRVRGIRIFVSGALEMCFVANGKLDFFISNKADIFSIAASYLILKESGGLVTDFRGDNATILSKKLIASNKYLHEKLSKLLKSI